MRGVLGRGLVLAGVVVTAAVVAIALHRNGHSQGDDFALYLRQARSIFDGDPAQVVADNRFAVLNSAGAFSPVAYPWGLPLLLSPFVRFWGLDYDRLKLVEVAAFCVWLVLVHGVVRRRAGRILALAVVAAVGTAPMLLVHTDSILSEYPQAAAVGVIIWWLDRMRSRGSLVGAPTRDLVILGLLVMVAYNIRRESVVLVAAIALVQTVELVKRWNDGTSIPWPSVATPHAAFTGSVIAFQLMLPSMLFPENADSGPQHIGSRLAEYPGVLTDQLGLEAHHRVGVAILALAVIGVVIGLARRPGLDGPLAAVAVLSMLAVSTHFRMVGRYYFQALPWVLYFGAVAVMAGARAVLRVASNRRDADRSGDSIWTRRAMAAVAAAPLAFLVAVHTSVLPNRISEARDFDRSGAQQIGPTHPDFVPVFDVVQTTTHPDAVVVYFRARTMTLLTDRRSIQTSNLERAEQRGDYYAQQRGSDYSQPAMTELEGRRRGYEIVWSDERWILWDLHPD